MYTAFYGLREKPFSLTPNPRFLYLADSHREAMAHLLYGLEQGEGFIVVTGEVGTGKTTICRSLLQRIEADTEIAILFNPSRSAHELLQSINEEFGLPAEGQSRRQLLSTLNRFLLDKHAVSRRVVLIIDEAQNLSPGTLEQVRLLSNLETESSKLIQIILLGQPELDEKLDSDLLRQLRQRVSVRWRLEPLPQSDTIAYVRHRLRVAAGAERDVITEPALKEIHRRTGGVPRLINVLADRALLSGYAKGAHRVGPSIVRRAAREVPASVVPRPHWQSPALIAAAAGAGVAVVAAVGGLAFYLTRDAGEPGAPGPVAAAPPPVSARPPGEPISSSETGPGASGPASAAVIVAPPRTATPLRDEEAWIGAPSEGSPLLRPNDFVAAAPADGQGAFLAALLSRETAAEGRLAAGSVLLERYGEERLDEAPESFEGLLEMLEDRGLTVTALPLADVALLERLDYPVLLPLQAATGDLRTVAVVAIDGEVAELVGARARGALRVPLRAVEEQWAGEAWVVWRRYLEVPELIGIGDEGAGVLWVQEALRRLGDFGGDISGAYDTDTAEGVRAFQQRTGLEPDGVAGPLTQMLLYGELEEFDPPRLGDAG